MTCYLCGSDFSTEIFVLKPDKYQELIGSETRRHWFRCERCGFYWQEHGLLDGDLDKIYKRYRDVSMRDTTVRDEFERIMSIPDSENDQRLKQLLNDGTFSKGNALDIGSGLGIFPNAIKFLFDKVYCIEPNADSVDFMCTQLGLNCNMGSYPKTKFLQSFDFISVIHVLEHIRDLSKFLSTIWDDLKNDGTLYIEVPDAVEFDYLEPEHDEFNSTHLWFFAASTLDAILRKAGFEPCLIRRLKYQERHLSRIMALCRKLRPS